jgi:hypothetical protein
MTIPAAEATRAPTPGREEAPRDGSDPRRPDPRRRVPWLLAALVLFQVVSSLLLAPFASRGLADTTLGYAGAFLTAQSTGHDSWGPMSSAVKSWRLRPELPVYHRLLGQHHSKIQYPPSSWLLTLASERLAPPLRLDPFRLLDLMGWISCWTTAFLAVWIFRRAQATGAPRTGGGPVEGTLLVALALLYYPLTRGFALGQVQSLITACLAGAIALWLAGRPTGAGALVGVAALFKPHYGLLLAFCALRRRWSALAAGIAVAGAGTLVALALFGLENHRDYLAALQLLAERGESFYANFSANGLLNRIAGLFDPRHNNAEWSARFPPFVPWVYWGTVLTSLVLLAFVFLRRRPAPTPTSETADLGFALLGVTMASPIAWEHHYGALIPLLALAGGALAGAGSGLPRRLAPALVAAWALSATFVEPAVRLAGSPWNFLQSYLYFGAIAALAVLAAVARNPFGGVVVRRRAGAPDAMTSGRAGAAGAESPASSI